MKVRVGIPRGLLYYEYFPLWRQFFRQLGAEVIESPVSTKQLLETGAYTNVDETCMPVKLYIGHAAALQDRVDYLFIPRIVSIREREYHCPKFSGLPDMVRSVFPQGPPVLEIIADKTENKKAFLPSLYKLGRHFSPNAVRVFTVYQQAVRQWRATSQAWKQGFMPQPAKYGRTKPLNIAVLGHSYNLYDTYGNNNLLQILHNLGVHVFTPDNINYNRAMGNAEQYLPDLCWSLGKKIYGTAVAYAARRDINGIILVMSFECGPDSLLMDLVNREITACYNKPVMTLVLDEHSGEAGLMTRLEAFVDMVKRRPRA